LDDQSVIIGEELVLTLPGFTDSDSEDEHTVSIDPDDLSFVKFDDETLKLTIDPSEISEVGEYNFEVTVTDSDSKNTGTKESDILEFILTITSSEIDVSDNST
jgi:hypothetical protein